MEPGGVQPAPKQGQDVQVPSGQELGPEATAHHLYLTDVRAKKGAPTVRPPRSTDSGSRRVQCWQAGGHCCPGNPTGQLFPLTQASPSSVSFPFPFSHLHRKIKLNSDGPWCPHNLCLPSLSPTPQEGGQGSQRCCIGGGHALGGCRPD